MDSLDDTPGRRIKLGSGSAGIFSYGAGAVVPLVLSNRQIELGGGGTLNNNATNVNCTVTVNKDLIVPTPGKPFTLGGSNMGKNIFAVVIPNGVTNFTKSGTGLWISSLNNTYGGSTAVSAGTLILSGTNTYTGATSIGAGATLVIQSIANYGVNCSIGAASSGTIAIGGSDYTGYLVYRGDTASCDRTVQVGSDNSSYQGGATILNYGTGDLTFTANPFNTTYANGNSNTRTLTLGGTRGGTIAGVIQNNNATYRAGFAKRGSGTWTLQGDNTYTGNSSAAGGGNLVLDYTTNTGSKLSDIATLTLGGSTITLKGGSGLTEVVTNTTVSAGASFITRDGGDTKLQLNAITRQEGGTIEFANATIADTTSAGTNGILGGYATLGDNWAVGGSPITALASYTGTLPQTGGTNTANYTLTGGQQQTGDVLANTVKIANSGNSQTLDLTTKKITITSTSATVPGGILYVGGNDNNYAITATSGNGLDASGAYDLVINTVRGTLSVSAKINGSNGDRKLVKTGAGKLVVSSANAYAKATYVNQGVLQLANATASGTTAGGITVQYGAAVELAGGISVGAEALAITGTGVSNGGALRNVAGNTSSYAGAITIGDDGARINSDAGGSLTLSGGIVTAMFKDVTIGGEGNTTVSSAISGAGNLIKDGSGTLTLSGTQTYTGETTVNGGILALGGHNVLNGKAITLNNGATLDAGTFTNTLSTLTVSSGASLALNAGAVLAFADCSGVQWSGTISLNKSVFSAGTSLRFGTSSSGLTPAQITALQVPGYKLSIDANGYLTGIPSGTLILIR